MTGLFNPKTLLMILILVEAIITIPVPKSSRRRKKSQQKQNLLKVHNFTLKLKTPTNSRTFVLWSRNGQVYLQANKNLTPGTNQTQGPRAEFEGEMMSTGIVRLRNVLTNKYLSISRRGRLLLQAKPNDDCLFHQRIGDQGFNTYASYKYYKKEKFDIFIAVKHSGDIKSPLATAKDQKAILFNQLQV